MCIAVPMRVLEVRSDSDVVVTRPGRTEIANASFADEMPAVGDLVLVFRGTILRTVSQDEALKIESALCCVEEAMRTDEAESADAAFADIIENTGELPPHLQKLVGQIFLCRQLIQAAAVALCKLGHEASPTFLINSSIRA